MENNKFYVYCHVKKTDGKCFYIGKGIRDRSVSLSGRNTHWKKMGNIYSCCNGDSKTAYGFIWKYKDIK